MPEWMWIIIAAGGIATLAVILKVISKRGLNASYGRSSIVIEGQYHQPDNALSKALTQVSDRTPQLQDVLLGVYLKLLKRAGADPDYLAEYEDARFVRMLLQYLVNGGNGSYSVQKIIESEIIHGEWRREGDDIREYVTREVWPKIRRRMKDFLNQEYDTSVLRMDGTRRKRLVSNTDFVDAVSSEASRDELVERIVPLFSYARRCVSDGCEG